MIGRERKQEKGRRVERMRPSRLAVSSCLVSACALLTACAGEGQVVHPYGVDDCRRVSIIDSETLSPIRGAEDFAIDHANDTLFVSAYDRRAAEKAAKKKRDVIPHGGVYAMELTALFNPSVERVRATSLVSSSSIDGGLRPHGISYDAARGELVVINRAYEREGRRWAMTPHALRIKLDSNAVSYDAAHCAANDVTSDTDALYVSFDHERCDWRAGLEDLFNLKRAGVVKYDETAAFSGVGFANGLATTPTGDLALAATRENSLIVLRDLNGALNEITRFKMPGGPDNLTISHDGKIIAAAHPTLWKLGLNRKMGIGTAPSRIVKVDQQSGIVTTLFDDPSGKTFSAATVAVETKHGIVVGSVTDEGVLVCEAAP